MNIHGSQAYRPLSEERRGFASMGQKVIGDSYQNNVGGMQNYGTGQMNSLAPQNYPFNAPNSSGASPYMNAPPMMGNQSMDFQYPNSANAPGIPSLNTGGYPPAPQGNYGSYGFPPNIPQNINNSYTAGMPVQNDQNSLLQKLLEESNSNQANELENQNQDLLRKIEEIERENQRLADGIDESGDPNNFDPTGLNSGLNYDDQKVIGDAIDKAIRQYEQTKAKEDFEIQRKKEKEEERAKRNIPRPSPEDILFGPISDQELFDNATSLPPVSKPFMSPNFYNIRGHNQFERPFLESRMSEMSGVSARSSAMTDLQDRKKRADISFKDLFDKSKDLMREKETMNNPPPVPPKPIKPLPASVMPQAHDNNIIMTNDKLYQDRMRKQEEVHKDKLIQKHGYFDANFGRGKNLHQIFKDVRKN